MSAFPSSDAEPFLHVSVHDVTPDAMHKVRGLLEFLRNRGQHDVTLLVVPGHRWRDAELVELHKLVAEGYRLAGHGWHHHCDAIRDLGHLLHSLFISRNVAEHLALDRDGIATLIRRCHDWFGRNDLPAPELYVPPAWAMGAIARNDLAELPFRYYEYLTGFFDAAAGRFCRVPLVGFEADSWARFLSLWPSNQCNLLLGRLTSSLRIALHPHDQSLLMSAALRSMFDSKFVRNLSATASTP